MPADNAAVRGSERRAAATIRRQLRRIDAALDPGHACARQNNEALKGIGVVAGEIGRRGLIEHADELRIAVYILRSNLARAARRALRPLRSRR